MPSTTERQRRFMGADLARLRAGKGTKTGMTENQLRDYAKRGKRAKGSKRCGRRTKRRLFRGRALGRSR